MSAGAAWRMKPGERAAHICWKLETRSGWAPGRESPVRVELQSVQFRIQVCQESSPTAARSASVVVTSFAAVFEGFSFSRGVADRLARPPSILQVVLCAWMGIMFARISSVED